MSCVDRCVDEPVTFVAEATGVFVSMMSGLVAASFKARADVALTNSLIGID